MERVIGSIGIRAKITELLPGRIVGRRNTVHEHLQRRRIPFGIVVDVVGRDEILLDGVVVVVDGQCGFREGSRRSSISRLRCMVTLASGSADRRQNPDDGRDNHHLDERKAPLIHDLLSVTTIEAGVNLTGIVPPLGLAMTPLMVSCDVPEPDRVELERRQQSGS